MLRLRWLAGRSFTTRSPIEMRPSLMSSSPAIIRSSVDLAATRGADQHHELARAHLEVDAMHHLEAAIGFAHALELHTGQDRGPFT